MPNSLTIRDLVLKIVTGTLRNTGREVHQIHDDDHLGDKLGLSSLDFAVIVVDLEAELGNDPFRTAAPRVQTFGQLVQLYEQANEGASHKE